MHKAYLLLGSNLGNRQANLRIAQESLENGVGTMVKASKLYETRAWGNTDQPDFLNQVVLVHTNLTPEKLLDQLLAIEKKMGRKRLKKWGERIIDLDILFYDELVLKSERLTIPHPGIPHRRFTLVPLCELSLGLNHPELKKSMAELLAACSDLLAVKEV